MLTNQIKLLRERKGISKYRLSKLVGVSQKTIRDWESNKKQPRPSNLEKLSKIFDTSIYEIMNIYSDGTSLVISFILLNNPSYKIKLVIVK